MVTSQELERLMRRKRKASTARHRARQNRLANGICQNNGCENRRMWSERLRRFLVYCAPCNHMKAEKALLKAERERQG